MRPRAAEDPMQNTWSIGRTWKPREGWSRPVLMVERQPTSTRPRGCVAQDPAGPREGAQGARSSHAHDQSTATRIASIVRSPNRHTPAGNPRFPADNPRFAAAMAQERRPVPFRTRKLRPGTAMVLHPTGCGRVARRRTTRQGPPDEANNPRGPTHTQTQQPTGMRSTHPIRFTGATVSEDGSRWSRTVLNAVAATHKPKRT